METMEADYSFGIEEEYFLVDAETNALTGTMSQPFLDAAKAAVRKVPVR
jgi:hypothetical protein